MTQKSRDSSFTLLFKKEKYLADLYEFASGKKVSPDEIGTVRLVDSLIAPKLYNDVAFITKENHLLVLIEHQTTPSKSMLYRMLEYYVVLTSKFIRESQQNKYGTKEIQVPEAELYVVYNGKGKMKELPVLNLGDIKVKAKVKNIHFDHLSHRSPNNAVVAYARFVQLIEEEQLFVNDALDQVLEEGYLVDFFGRKENRDMFAEVFSYDKELIEFGAKKGREEERKKIEAEKLASAQGLVNAGMEIELVAKHLNISDMFKKLKLFIKSDE